MLRYWILLNNSLFQNFERNERIFYIFIQNINDICIRDLIIYKIFIEVYKNVVFMYMRLSFNVLSSEEPLNEDLQYLGRRYLYISSCILRNESLDLLIRLI